MEQLISALDDLIIAARLQDIAAIARSDRSSRTKRLATALHALSDGHYLLGCGPYNSGIIRIGTTEIMLGRSASPLEEHSETVVDYYINDTIYLGPREVSRVHASLWIDHEEGNSECLIRDESSSCGTYLNGARLSGNDPSRLQSGDVITLGESGINVYLYVIIDRKSG